jgi:hypothetical protein
MVMNGFRTIIFMQPMRKLNVHLRKINFYLFFGFGGLGRIFVVLNVFPKMFPKMFPIPSNFYPICFAQGLFSYL